MPKLDVGVGDEFPAGEMRNAEKPEETVVVHHHHYRRRRPRWLFIVLWVMVVSLLFRLIDLMVDRPTETGWGWGPRHWRPYHSLEGLLMGLGVVAILLWFACRRGGEDGGAR